MTAPLNDVGTMTASWTAPDGTVVPLSNISPDIGWFTTFGVGGWGARPYELTLDPMPRGGDSVRFIRAQSGRLTWPLHIYGDSHVQFTDRYRAIRRAIMMTVHRRQSGTLRVQRPDGTSRSIQCFYEDGFGGEPGENWLSANPVLTLLCPDAYWRGDTPVTEVRAFSPPIPQSFLAGFPNISPAKILGVSSVDNAGEVDAWPEWVVSGPMTSLTATNYTTGHTFIVTFSLLAGQTVTINTLQPTVRGPAGENLTASLNWPSAYLWPLAPGTNNVDLAVGGAGATTSVSMTFHPRFEGV